MELSSNHEDNVQPRAVKDDSKDKVVPEDAVTQAIDLR